MNHNIAAMSIGGGRKDNFFLSLLTYYSDSNRWFLKTIMQLKEEDGDRDEVLSDWFHEHEVSQLIIDFPLSLPSCQSCELACPGLKLCPVTPVVEVKKMIDELLSEDEKVYKENPKKYEQERLKWEEFRFNPDVWEKETQTHILSRSFKRRLKKGYLPYWNRPIDFYLWKNYYDQMLGLFNFSFDSFGKTAVMLLFRFSYLKRHFPSDLLIYQSHAFVSLIELLRMKIINQSDLFRLNSLEEAPEARLDILKGIEKNLKIFIYDKDLESIVKNPRAFDSFLLAVVGQRLLLDKTKKMPDWTYPKETNFIIPLFEKNHA